MTMRRVLLLAGAGLTLASLLMPLWGFRMSAPQYPDETLHLRIDRGGIGGDVQEIETLQKYIGVRFPRELPELRWLTPSIVALAAMLACGGLVGHGRAGRAVRAAVFLVFAMFLMASAAVVQVRLYQVGHDRAADAPIRAVRDFTPPLIGPIKVGNFTVWSFPHAGAMALLAAAGCAFVAARAPSRSEA
jgi:hypothetical protein